MAKELFKLIVCLGFIGMAILCSHGCATITDQSFNDEEYIWEDWTIGTNSVEALTND